MKNNINGLKFIQNVKGNNSILLIKLENDILILYERSLNQLSQLKWLSDSEEFDDGTINLINKEIISLATEYPISVDDLVGVVNTFKLFEISSLIEYIPVSYTERIVKELLKSHVMNRSSFTLFQSISKYINGKYKFVGSLYNDEYNAVVEEMVELYKNGLLDSSDIIYVFSRILRCDIKEEQKEYIRVILNDICRGSHSNINSVVNCIILDFIDNSKELGMIISNNKDMSGFDSIIERMASQIPMNKIKTLPEDIRKPIMKLIKKKLDI